MTRVKGRANKGKLYRYAVRLVFCGLTMAAIPLASAVSASPEKTLYAFSGAGHGSMPEGPVVFDNTGALYGTTYGAGKYQAGTVFKLAPPSGTKLGWAESVIYAFKGGADGGMPASGLLGGPAG